MADGYNHDGLPLWAHPLEDIEKLLEEEEENKEDEDTWEDAGFQVEEVVGEWELDDDFDVM